MTSLQLGLIAAGVVLVVGVIIYNWLQERRVRHRIREAFRDTGSPNERSEGEPRESLLRGGPRVEPTLARSEHAPAAAENPARETEAVDDDAPYEPPQSTREPS